MLFVYEWDDKFEQDLELMQKFYVDFLKMSSADHPTNDSQCTLTLDSYRGQLPGAFVNGVAFYLKGKNDDFRIELTYPAAGVFILTVDLSIENINTVLDLQRCFINQAYVRYTLSKGKAQDNQLPNLGVIAWPSHQAHFNVNSVEPTFPLWKAEELKGLQDFMFASKKITVYVNASKERKEISRLIQNREAQHKTASDVFRNVYNERCLAYLDQHQMQIRDASAELQALHRKRLDQQSKSRADKSKESKPSDQSLSRRQN